MGDVTKIQWTDATWNPVRGCSRVSPGCDNCYAMHVAHRFSGPGLPYEGLTTLRKGKPDWSGVARMVPDHLADPLRWTKPRRVFVNSMSDLFHHSITNEQIAAVFGVMAASPRHTFQILTKRPERMVEWFSWLTEAAHGYAGEARAAFCVIAAQGVTLKTPSTNPWALRWPLPGVWLGVSCENQEAADKRIPLLLECPAAVRFVSAEPLLGPIDMRAYLTRDFPWTEAGGPGECEHGYAAGVPCRRCKPSIDWVIVGGESGPGARPCYMDWVGSIVEQCRAAGVACFVKQLGAQPMSERGNERGTYIAGGVRDYANLIHDRKGGDMAEWPEALRVREFPRGAA